MRWDERCFICEGRFSEEDDRAEMCDPQEADLPEECRSNIVHAECGQAAGWKIA